MTEVDDDDDVFLIMLLALAYTENVDRRLLIVWNYFVKNYKVVLSTALPPLG